MDTKDIEVVMTPALIPYYNLKGRVAVVADILRATTTMCMALHNGARAIYPFASLNEAAALRGEGWLTAGEREGEKVPGFDLGNSPTEMTSEIVGGKSLAISTTNGTMAIKNSSDAEKIIIGSFANIKALANYLRMIGKPITIVAAGWKNRFNLEDVLFAGALIDLMPEFELNCDSSMAAHKLYLQSSADIEAFLFNASHTTRFRQMGIESEISYCLTRDLTNVVPLYADGSITVLNSEQPALAV